MTYRRKYAPGKVLAVREVIEAILEHRYVYWRDRPYHHGWIGSWRLHYIRAEAMMSRFREAIPQPALPKRKVGRPPAAAAQNVQGVM